MNELMHGDCLEVMKTMEDNTIASIVTDPPYGLGFLNKHWDAGLPNSDIWTEALRICKPGSFLLAFGGTRTYHRLTCAIEDAGWEIRDCLMWVYGGGFPKSHNHFGIEGFGTCLKPSYEPIVMAMKPLDGTFKQNAKKWGQAGINIDGCRVGSEIVEKGNYGRNLFENDSIYEIVLTVSKQKQFSKGRWPANTLWDEESAKMLDDQSGILKSGKLEPYKSTYDHKNRGWRFGQDRDYSSPPNSGGASRFFYCAKASPSERNEGLEGLQGRVNENSHFATTRLKDLRMVNEQNRFPKKNYHPCVKPLTLMKYLITLVMPPKDGLLLDPFAGSGTTLLAAKQLGFNYIGIEKEEEYCTIAQARLKSA